MSKKKKSILKTVLISVTCCALFVGMGYTYLKHNIKSANNVTPHVSYYSSVPDDAGIMLEIGDDKTLFFLDFQKEQMTVILLGESEIDTKEAYGYDATYSVKGDYELVSAIVDSIDGIDLFYGGEMLCRTGVQVTDIISRERNSNEIKKEIISAIFKKISSNGFDKNDLYNIIELSKTDLTVPICYKWTDYIENICKSVRFVG